MENSELNIFFIIGAPRSGTHLLAKSINYNVDCISINEVNTFWQQYAVNNTDFCPNSKFSEKEIKKIRKKYITRFIPDQKAIVIEKTAANSVRINFLKKVFPEAKFIHIIRDGRDVAVSVKNKYLGDLRKITKNKTNNSTIKEKYRLLLKSYRRVLKSGLTLRVLFSNFFKYLRFLFISLKIIKKQYWGIRYPGYKIYFNNLSFIESAAMQWQTSILHIKNALQPLSDHEYFEIFYEDLINTPHNNLNNCISFINGTKMVSTPIHEIDITSSNFTKKLSSYEKQKVEAQVGYILNCLGYE